MAKELRAEGMTWRDVVQEIAKALMIGRTSIHRVLECFGL
jgi:hypothetical protein